MNTSLSSVRNSANIVEKGFDIAGYIPGISSISGPLRSVVGKVMLLVGVFFWVGSKFIQECAYHINRSRATSYTRVKVYDQLFLNIQNLGQNLEIGRAHV